MIFLGQLWSREPSCKGPIASLLWSEPDWVHSRARVDSQWFSFCLSCSSWSFPCFFSTTIVTENPSWISINMAPNFYYDGDCNDPNVQANITANFIGLMTSNAVPPFFCTIYPNDCNVNTVDVACGALTVPDRRRKRRSVREVRDFSTWV